MYSVLYWLNLSLANMLKGRQVDMTCLEQKVTIKIPCYHLGRRYFFLLKGKFDITSSAYGFPYIFYSIFFIGPSYEDKPTYSSCQGWLNWALCFLERFLKVLFFSSVCNHFTLKGILSFIHKTLCLIGCTLLTGPKGKENVKKLH